MGRSSPRFLQGRQGDHRHGELRCGGKDPSQTGSGPALPRRCPWGAVGGMAREIHSPRPHLRAHSATVKCRCPPFIGDAGTGPRTKRRRVSTSAPHRPRRLHVPAAGDWASGSRVSSQRHLPCHGAGSSRVRCHPVWEELLCTPIHLLSRNTPAPAHRERDKCATIYLREIKSRVTQKQHPLLHSRAPRALTCGVRAGRGAVA